MSETTLREAEALAARGEIARADAAFRGLYRPERPDPAHLLAWARLRRQAGDVRHAGEMLQQALSAGGGEACRAELADLLIDAGEIAAAARLLVPLRGESAPLLHARGRLEEAAGRAEAALAHYRAATRAEPRHFGARLAAARLLARGGRPAKAEAALRALLKRAPGHVAALAELAWLLGSQHRYREALAVYEELEAAGVDVVRERAMLTLGFLHACDWSVRDGLHDWLARRFRGPQPAVADPYALFALSDDPGLHRAMAERIAAAIARHTAGMARPVPRGVGSGRRLRIGYLCGDFNQHATSLLMAGVLEAHDHARFEIVAYDYSAEDGSAIRERIRRAFPRFVSLGMETPAESATRIAGDGIDILVDLKGYTERTRCEILALRPAPIQVNFLGYVGTQAGGWTDYVIADRHVLPPEALGDWTEQPVWMPVTYYPSDRTRPRPPAACRRADHGLPDGAFVFACFNNPFKIAPEFFAAWMRLLHAVPGSVLWLYAGNPLMPENIRAEAVRADVDPARIVFAPPASLDAHIGRHGCADLFLDTAPYGAHTTGVDALWAGLPVVTCAGRSFASRVGASLLHAVGLPELVTHELASYEALALALARDAARLARLRAHLVAARKSAPLFDAVAFCRALERGYEMMAAREVPGAIVVET